MAIRHATVSGGGLGDGTSVANAWTLPQAVANAQPGDIVHVQAGNYGSINLSQTINGSVGNPIIFRGYTSVPDDIAVLTTSSFNKNSAVDPSFSPTFTAANVNAWLIDILGTYVTFENFQMSGSNFGVQVRGAQSTLKNCLIREIGDLSSLAYSGFGVRLSANQNKLYNCVVVNSGAENITVRDSANNAHVRYTTSACDNTTNPTDYYVILTGVTGVVVEDCISDRANGLSHQGHGFECKFDANNNTLRNNTVIGTFVIASFGSSGNLFENFTVDSHFNDIGDVGANATFGVRVGKNANNNVFRNFFIRDTWIAIGFSSFEEGSGDANNAGFDNKFFNFVVYNSRHLIGGDPFQDNGHPAYDNKFYNFTVYRLTGEIFYTRRPLNNFEFYNTVIHESTGFESSANGYSLSTSSTFSHINVTGGGASTASFAPYNSSNITSITVPFSNPGALDFSMSTAAMNIGRLTENTTDYNGDTYTNPYTLGAYQFSGSNGGGGTPTPRNRRHLLKIIYN